MHDYNEYEKIEQHMFYARRLNAINSTGKRILQQMDEKKRMPGRKKLLEYVFAISQMIETIVKPHVLCNNLYSSLIFYMDELLFFEVRNLNSFVVEDDNYPLSYIYFNTSDWNESEQQEFHLDQGVYINEMEAMLMNCFVDEYEEFVLSLEGDIIRLGESASDQKLMKKILRIITRLKKRLTLLRSRLLKIIHKGFNVESTTRNSTLK